MKDLALTADGDLDCTEIGVLLIDGTPRVAQQVRTRLRTFLGEWEFDLDAGVPWFQRILGTKGVNLNDVENILREQMLDVADVTGVVEFQMSFDGEARRLTITAKISTTFGAVPVEGVFP